ncbi:MAG: hypothetical protein Q8P67_12095 [archaeon]|nr:hypothetical protein [archaeon]
MLRRKPFRLVLSDTLGELEQELADTQAERAAERSERSIGSDSSEGSFQFVTPEKTDARSAHERIGFEGPSVSRR